MYAVMHLKKPKTNEALTLGPAGTVYIFRLHLKITTNTKYTLEKNVMPYENIVKLGRRKVNTSL